MARKSAKAAAKTTTRKSVKKTATRSTAKRERIDTGTDTRYAKRALDGTWTEMDDSGRSLRADRARAAKKTVKPGFGDLGDQKPHARKKAAKKR